VNFAGVFVASPGKKVPMNFKSMAQADVPQGRNGKHKENRDERFSRTSIRSSRGCAESAAGGIGGEQGERPLGAESRHPQAGQAVATASDEEFLYCVERNDGQ
jgi:hypothetical protein